MDKFLLLFIGFITGFFYNYFTLILISYFTGVIVSNDNENSKYISTLKFFYIGFMIGIFFHTISLSIYIIFFLLGLIAHKYITVVLKKHIKIDKKYIFSYIDLITNYIFDIIYLDENENLNEKIDKTEKKVSTEYKIKKNIRYKTYDYYSMLTMTTLKF